jgi:class 3 adenylate cyclase
MRKSLKAFNDSELLQKQSLKIENGIGIATGASIAANLGKNYSRKFFTIIGELSDSAEHLESQTKSGSFSKIMIDKNTIKLVKSHFKMSINTKNQDSESAELISEVI